MRRLWSVLAMATLCCTREDRPADATQPSSGPWFREIAAASGVIHRREPSDYQTLQGRMAGGVCLLDVNRDGRTDLFFPGAATGSHLYVAGPAGKFADESVARNIANTGQSSGCVAVDIDGDGDDDVLTTGFGGARLFVNNDGVFADASARLGAPFRDKVVTTAAVAFDADRDGDLDLAVTSYGVYKGGAANCNGPCESDILQYDYGSSVLLFQRPDGTFADESARLGMFREPGLVATATDLDGDGVIDLFVGNDIASFPDRYYRNDGKGTFTEVGKQLGVAFNSGASGVYSMSATDGDVDGDGHLDLTQSSWDEEPSSVFRCSGKLDGGCLDIHDQLELFRTPRNFRWGQLLLDLDHDGLPELFESVGHYQIASDSPGGVSRFPTQDNCLLWSRRAVDVPFARQTEGVAFSTGGRGVVATDLDGDGDLDVIVASAIGPPLILENVRQGKGHHLTVRLRGKGKNTAAIGARVTITVGTRRRTAIVHAGAGFMSSDNGAVHFGVGPAMRIDAVDVIWPTGARSTVNNVVVDALLVLTEF